MEIMKINAEQNQEMLKTMLPDTMIDKFKSNDTSVVVDTYAEVSVLFIIIDNFVTITQELQAENLVRLLNIVYTEFDKITEEQDVYKIETVGEVYMCCVGCPNRAIDHADKAANCALAMIANMQKVRELLEVQLEGGEGQLNCCKNLNIKLGINSGKIVAGVLNTPATIRFKLFGDTVNTASRMQSLSSPGKVQISEATYKKLIKGAKHLTYIFSEPRVVSPKGKGDMNVWYINGLRTSSQVSNLTMNRNVSVIDRAVVDAKGNELKGVADSIAGKIRSKLGALQVEDGSGRRGRSTMNIKSTVDARMLREAVVNGGGADGTSSGAASSTDSSSGGNSVPHSNGDSNGPSNPALEHTESIVNMRGEPDNCSMDDMIKLYDDGRLNGADEGSVTDRIMMKHRLEYVFRQLQDRKQPELLLGQFLLSILGTDVRAIGKCEEAAVQESKYIVHKWSGHLRQIRLFQYFFSLNFVLQGGVKLNTLINRDSLDVAAEDELWKVPAREAGVLLHVINCFSVGLPLCATLIFMTFKRHFFWVHHQQIMVSWLILIGLSIVIETSIWVDITGFGTITMYIMTLYQYQLVFFVYRMMIALILALVYYMGVQLFAVDSGTDMYTMDAFGDERFRVPLNVDKYTFQSETTFEKPDYRNMTFNDMGLAGSCVDFLKEEAFVMMCGDDEKGCVNITNATGMSMQNLTETLFVNEGLLKIMGSVSGYWQIITSFRGITYFVWLLLYSLLLLVPSLMSDYHERVCFNKEIKQGENQQKMDEQTRQETNLLSRLLPPEIVDELAMKRATNTMVAEKFDEVTILCLDMVGFTKFSSELDPSELMIFLSALYAKYSVVISDNGLYTVEVIGDALLAVAGCPKKLATEDHATRALNAAFDLLEVTREFSQKIGMDINIRVGIHSGKVIAGVVGVKDPRYHIFGEAVKVAELMESSGFANHVHCSHRTWEYVERSTDENSMNLNLKFARRGDLDPASAAKLSGLDYGRSSYFVTRGGAGETTEKVKFRRLTIDRSQANLHQADLQRRRSGGGNTGGSASPLPGLG
jgi:class 3 adenylate cyclase